MQLYIYSCIYSIKLVTPPTTFIIFTVIFLVFNGCMYLINLVLLFNSIWFLFKHCREQFNPNLGSYINEFVITFINAWKECFHSRSQHLYKFTGTKESVHVAWEKSSTPRRLVWDTNMAAVSLFWDTNMAAVTSCENTLYCNLLLDKLCLLIKQ